MPVTLPPTPLATQADLDALAARVAALEHQAPPASKPSATGHYITRAADPPVVDDSLNLWSLVAAADTTLGLQIACEPPSPPMPDPVTRNVVKLGIDLVSGKRQIVQQNSSGNYYTASGPGQAWQQIAGPDGPVVPPVPTPGGIYKVSGGQIYRPDGAVFSIQGLCVLPDQLADMCRNAAGYPLTTLAPNTNCIVIATQNWSYAHWYDANAFIATCDQAIGWLTALKIVVVIADYANTDASQGSITGDNLTQCLAYHTALANKYKANARVWFMSGPNEGKPPTAAGAQHKATYDAIRATGNTNPIILYEQNTSNTGDFSLDNSAGHYDQMAGVVWSVHPYGGWPGALGGGSESDRGACQRALLEGVTRVHAASPQSKDGVIPVIMAEFGNAYGSDQPISSGTLFQEVVTYGRTICAGWCAWLWYWPGSGSVSQSDNVVYSNNTTTLTAGYGDFLAANMTADRRPV